MVSSQNEIRVEVLIFRQGNFNDDLNFVYENLTQAFFGCAAVFNDEMLYFGGVGADAKQVRSTFILLILILWLIGTESG